MTNEYFSYQRKESYIGYGKRTRGIREFILYSAIIAAGVLFSAAIILFVFIFFFPRDKMLALVPGEPLFYVNLRSGVFMGRQNFVSDMKKYAGFDLDLGEEEISFAGLVSGNLLLTPKNNISNMEEARSRYFTEEKDNYILVYNGERSDPEKVSGKNFKDDWKARLFFSRPSFSFLAGFVNNEKFSAALPGYLETFKENSAGDKVYFRAKEKDGKIILKLSGGKKNDLSYEPLFKNISAETLFLIRGIDIASYFVAWKNILPIEINDEALMLLYGKGELLVFPGEENGSPEFLVGLGKDLNEEEMSRLEFFLKRTIAEIFPREENIVLPSGEPAVELVARPRDFDFFSDGALKFLETESGFEFAFGKIKKDGKTFLIFSNSITKAKLFINSGDLSNDLDLRQYKECFYGEKSPIVYTKPSFLSLYSDFLAGFSQILVNSKGNIICLLK